jgi:hypothetical protein
MLARTANDERGEVIGDRNVFDVNGLYGGRRLGLRSARRHDRRRRERHVRATLAAVATASRSDREDGTGDEERASHASILIRRARLAR